MTKICNNCNKSVSIDLFFNHKHTKDGKINQCKPCCKILRKQWRDKNKEKITLQNKKANKKNKEYRQKYNEKHRDRYTDGYLIRTYGITFRKYKEMLIEQNNTCALCFREETFINNKSGTIKRLSVDHCHETGKVRRLLCHKCNKGLGIFNDDPDLLIKAAEYLKEHKQ